MSMSGCDSGSSDNLPSTLITRRLAFPVSAIVLPPIGSRLYVREASAGKRLPTRHQPG